MSGLILPLLLITAVAVVQGCQYISATQIDHNPPEEIPLWLSRNYGTESLCGYFTQFGYFKDLVEYDAFLRWTYPDIYDPRMKNLIMQCTKSNCTVNIEFAEKYWQDPWSMRKELREMWNYPADWREIIPVSVKLYVEGGRTLKALDRDVAITPGLIAETKSKYGQTDISIAPRERLTVQKEIPDHYKTVMQNYDQLKEIILQSLSSPATLSFITALITIAILASSNIAVAIAISRMRQGSGYRFFRKIN